MYTHFIHRSYEESVADIVSGGSDLQFLTWNLVFWETNWKSGDIITLEYSSPLSSNDKYQFTTMTEGINEEHILDFHSPYGCSKGAADQYVREYS